MWTEAMIRNMTADELTRYAPEIQRAKIEKAKGEPRDPDMVFTSDDMENSFDEGYKQGADGLRAEMDEVVARLFRDE